MINILHLIKVAAVVIVAAVSAGCERPVEITWDASSLHRVTGGVYARVKVLSDGRLALVYSAGPAVRAAGFGLQCRSCGMYAYERRRRR